MQNQTSTQWIADYFKRIVGKAPGGDKQAALLAISRLERAAWRPAVMQQAAEAHGAIIGDGNPPRLIAPPGEVDMPRLIVAIIATYLERLP